MEYIKRLEVKNRRYYGLYKCHCGKEFKTREDAVKSGNTKSCGCLHKNFLKSGNARRSHGLSQHRLWSIYRDIERRTTDKKRDDYSRYGGRGIKNEWASFEDFVGDMLKSHEDHASTHGEGNTTLDRIDNDGNYSKENCRWATQKVQANNTRWNKHLTHKGVTLTYTQWEEKLGLTCGTVSRRVKKGYKLEKVLNKENYGK